MRYYKLTDKAGRACHGGEYMYSLPRGRRAGAWTTECDDPVMCRRGWHVVDALGVGDWWRAGCRLWEAEAECPVGDGTGKYVCRRVRLVREVMLDVAAYEAARATARRRACRSLDRALAASKE